MRRHFYILFFVFYFLFFILDFSALAAPPYYPWEITFEVVGGNLKGYAAIGIEETAADGYDSRFDVVGFSPVNSSADYLFPYLNLYGIYFLSRQINGPYAASQWDMYIDTALPIGTVIELTWGSLPAGLSDLQLTFTDVQSNTVIDMQQQQTYSYTLTSSVQSMYFQIDLTVPSGDPDTDGDGMPDWWENQYGLDMTDASDAVRDNDGDGLTNLEEYQLGTDPTAIDTDGDGIPDGWEVVNGLDPLNPDDALIDSDSDGVINIDEIQAGTDPFDASDNIPAAYAGPDQAVDPALVTIDGSGSTDPNNDQLTYTWVQSASNPEQVSFINNGTSLGNVQDFIIRSHGQYLFSLTVSDGKVSSAPDDVIITVNNIPPTSDAGSSQSVDAGTVVTLDGSGSSDANGDVLTYSWVQESGVQVSLSGSSTVQPSFTPLETGVYTFSLIVSDGLLTSGSSTVAITVNRPNIVPTADAGSDQTVEAGVLVTLDGTNSSDSDNWPSPLSYTWVQSSGPVSVNLIDSGTPTPSFIPQDSGVYTFSLTVYDGKDYSVPVTVNITVNNPNVVPVADAGSDQEVIVGDTVQLSGSGSYDGDNWPVPLTYKWVQTQGTTVTLSDDTAVSPGFVPLSPDILVFSLTVYDGEDYSLPDEVTIIVNEIDEALVADAGEYQNGIEGEVITLDGSESYYKDKDKNKDKEKDKDKEKGKDKKKHEEEEDDDDDKDRLRYIWTQTGGSNITLYNADTPFPYFTPLLADIYKFSLTVGYDRLVSLPDEVVITIDAVDNMTPAADAGEDIESGVGVEVELDGTASYDPDGDSLSYEWKQVKGSRVTLSDSASSTPRFTPSKDGKYVFALTVNDGRLKSKPDKVKVYIKKEKKEK